MGSFARQGGQRGPRSLVVSVVLRLPRKDSFRAPTCLLGVWRRWRARAVPRCESQPETQLQGSGHINEGLGGQ